MPTFGRKDLANNAPLWALTQIPNTAPNTSNMTAVYANASASKAVYAANSSEAYGNKYGIGPGWFIVQRGTGGRAGRVQMEQLVAGLDIANNADDSAILLTQRVATITGPTSKSVTNNTANGFVVSYTTIPSGLTLSVQWQINANGAGYANIANAGIYTNATALSLGIANVTSTLNNATYRVGLFINTVPITYSNAATLTVT